MAFIRTSKWNEHDVQVGQKDSEGAIETLAYTDVGGISRDLSIKGIHVRKGGASLHKLEEFSLKPNILASFLKQENTSRRDPG